MLTIYHCGNNVPVIARVASRALGDGLHLKREQDVVGAAPLADVTQVVAALMEATFDYSGFRLYGYGC